MYTPLVGGFPQDGCATGCGVSSMVNGILYAGMMGKIPGIAIQSVK